MAPKLYQQKASPPCRAVLLTIKALDLKVDLVNVNLLEKEQYADHFLQINPQHTLPTLLEENGFSLWDSHAINAYLVEKYGKSDELYPSDLEKRATINQRLHFDSNVLAAKLASITSSLLRDGAKSVTKDKSDAMVQAYSLLELLLEGKNKNYLAGEKLTIADFNAVATISSANILVPLAENRFPNIIEWLERMRQLPYYDEANLEGLNLWGGLMKSKMAR